MGYPGYPPPPGYPQYPGYPPPAPQRSTSDVTISIVIMVLTILMGAAAVFFGIFSLAFLDYCPPATCSAEGAATAVMTSLGVAALVGLVGMVVTIIQLARRKRAWPFAAGTFGLCVLVLFFGVLGYSAAVGA